MKLTRSLPRVRLARIAASLAAGLTLASVALAQEPPKDGEKPELEQDEPELPDFVIPDLNGEGDPEQEMIRLFHEVERTLQSIDLELYDASAGRIPIPEGRESGMERLLRSHGSKSDQAVSGMERILELAQQMGGSCSRPGGGGEPKPTGGESPLDKERQRGPTQDEKTPEAPKPKEGEQPGQAQPKPEGEQPDDRGQNPPPGENRPAQPRTDAAGNPVPSGDDADRWGVLPERVQRVFQNQITDDLPLEYRDWIDSYYRRLSKVR